MRKRRAERCVLRADIALDAGFPDDARAALEEARRLDPRVPQLAEIEARLAAADSTSEAAPRPGRKRALAAAAAAVVIAAGVWGVRSYRTAPPAHPVPVTANVATPALPSVLPAAIDSSAVQVRTEQLEVSTIGSFAAEEPPPQPARGAPPLPELPVPTVFRASEPPELPPARVEPVANIPVDTSAPSLSVEPVSAAALPVSAPPPAPAPAVDERQRVRSILARYEAAYSNLDAGAAQAVWPGVDGNALARAFGNLQSQQLSLGRCDVTVSAASARASCAGSAAWRPKVGSGRTEPRRWDFTLQNTGGNWTIVNASTR